MSGIDHNSPVMQARTTLVLDIARHNRGEISGDALNASADAYIDAIKAHAKATGKKLPVPSRAKVIRALG